MKLLSPIIDRLQATFPPNRLMLLLAGPIVAASAWTSGFVSSNIPGVTLPVGVVAGIMGAAVLLAITLIYKWFDQWQAGEPINVDRDLEDAFAEIVDSHGTIDKLLGGSAGVRQHLEELHNHVVDSTINPAELVSELEASIAALGHLIEGHDQAPQAEVASPAPVDAAPPTATTAE